MSVTFCLESISFFIVKNCHNKKRGNISISGGKLWKFISQFYTEAFGSFRVVVHLSLLCERQSNCEETALGSPSKENDGKVDLWYTDRGKKKPKGGRKRKRETEKGEQKSNRREEGRESRCSFNPTTTTTAALHIIPVWQATLPVLCQAVRPGVSASGYIYMYATNVRMCARARAKRSLLYACQACSTLDMHEYIRDGVRVVDMSPLQNSKYNECNFPFL